MNKFIGISLAIVVLFGLLLCIPVLAEETTITENGEGTPITISQEELIQSLKEQIARLKESIEALRVQMRVVQEARGEIRETLKLIRQLEIGMTGEDIELLQEILKTDTEVYPEGLVTGYFGPLTQGAVKRFQKMAGIEQVGRVGPKTISKINELLEEGAGKSGKVPPGLLIAPGIRKKLGFAPQPLPGQELPPGIAKKLGGETPGDGEDTTPPLISEISALNTTTSSIMITWLTDEEADSKVWYDTLTPLVVTDTTSTAVSFDLVLSHEIELSDLIPDTTYYYLVSSTDSASNSSTSEEQLFGTLSE